VGKVLPRDENLVHTNTDADIGMLGTMINGGNDFLLGGYTSLCRNCPPSG
jgi:hypothetical protein